jgi:toluene monooxygenase system ferredoxin subunit
VSFRRAARLEDLWEGEIAALQLEGRRLALIKIGDQVVTFLDACAHRGLPISDGRLEDGELICAAHEYRYRAATGRGINPDSVCLVRFPTEVRGGEVWVDLEEERRT